MKSAMAWSIRLALRAVCGNEPLDHRLMNFDLSLFDQGIPNAFREEGRPVARYLALNVVADGRGLLRQLRHIRRNMLDHARHHRAFRYADRSEEGSVGTGEGLLQ